MPQFWKIVMTGGPCGGKTTAMSKITEYLDDHGIRVVVVPEVATAMFTHGISMQGMSPAQVLEIEQSMMAMQIAQENTFERAARASGQKTLMLVDRGALDYKAYVPPSMWDYMLEALDVTELMLRDRRYDAVIHLVTAANGAQEFYTLANNPARTETAAEAIALDNALQHAWTGHPHLRVIDNASDFSGKMQRTLAAICRVVGVPEPLEVERKFLVRFEDLDHSDVFCRKVLIEQVYLNDGSRIRKRGQSGFYVQGRWKANESWVYTHTVKRPHPTIENARYETEERISAWEYARLLEKADPERTPILKRRACFLWDGRYWELDTFIQPNPGLMLLEIELDENDATAEITLPPFIGIEREVTAESNYSNRDLSLNA